MFLYADSECPDQTAQIRSLICTFAVRICQKRHVFAWLGGWIYRLIWVFAGLTGLIIGFVVRGRKYVLGPRGAL